MIPPSTMELDEDSASVTIIGDGSNHLSVSRISCFILFIYYTPFVADKMDGEVCSRWSSLLENLSGQKKLVAEYKMFSRFQ